MSLSLLNREEQCEASGMKPADLATFLPPEIGCLENPQVDLPQLARNRDITTAIEAAVQRIPTHHIIRLQDARSMAFLEPESVHLVLTSPPYWTLKRYQDSEGQLGHIDDYDLFTENLSEVWRKCFEALVPGGRLICVVGDVCLSRRKNGGRHTVVPLHATIQEHCRKIGFDNLAPIIWHKIANASYEADNTGGFLGKPYEPNSIIKNDIEYILMERKPGGYRAPSIVERALSVISAENHGRWFQQIWTGLQGASTKGHPAPFPVALADRLVRMFSFVGDTVLDPFMGSATTNLAAARWGRNSIGVEIDPTYFEQAYNRLCSNMSGLFTSSSLETFRDGASDT